MICFPGGTPDLSDIREGGVLDVAGSMRRELKEETGLDLDEFDADPGWTIVHNRGFFGLLKRARSGLNAEALRAKILQHLASDPHPEFAEIRIVRTPADIDSRMFKYLRRYFEYEWQR